MWIRRLSVQHWRGLSYVLDGLGPGLNLIAGANESGKSRLVEALRFALFESTSGQAAHKRALESWSVAPEKPRVTVDFALCDIDWQLEKVFLDKGCNTRLRGGGKEHRGEEAEARLAEMLGVHVGSGKTAVKLADCGIWPLLWVDQGASREQPAHTEVSKSRILDELGETIGEVAAGVFGMTILSRAEEQRNRYYTPRSSAEKSSVTEPRRRVSELEVRLARATERRSELAAAADALNRTRDSIGDLATRHATAERVLRETAARQEHAQDLRHALDLAEERVAGALRGRDEARLQLERAEEHAREREALGALIEGESRQLASEEANRAALQEMLDSTGTECERLEAHAEAAAARIRTLLRRKEVDTQRIELERVRRRFEAARRIVGRQAEIRTELGTLVTIDVLEVSNLRKAVETRANARARLDGASVSLALTAYRDVVVDGAPIAAGAAVRILVNDDRHIEISDLLGIEVKPGAGELVALREMQRDAERAVDTLLDSFGVTDVEQAAEIADRRDRLTEERDRLAQALEEHAPEGMSALELLLRNLEGAVHAAMSAEAPTATSDETELVTAQADLVAIETARGEARVRRDTAREQLTLVRERSAGLRSSLETLQNQQGALARRLASQPDGTGLRAALDSADRTFAERVAARDDLRRRFESSGGEQLDDDVERAGKAEAQLRRKLQDAREERIRLETILGAAGEDGRHELVQELEAELAQARDLLARVLREAAAARRLFEVLDNEYKSSRERLTQPVIEHIRPYLEEVFPGSEAWLDESLELRGLRSNVANEQFEALSGGAREQLSLLVRIGLAEVLGNDEPWPLVLDDVLVNTDAERIQCMQRALYRAGRRMQILLFTCHGALFDTLGPDVYIELPAPAPRAALNARGEET